MSGHFSHRVPQYLFLNLIEEMGGQALTLPTELNSWEALSDVQEVLPMASGRAPHREGKGSSVATLLEPFPCRRILCSTSWSSGWMLCWPWQGCYRVQAFHLPRLPNMLYLILRGKSVTLVLKLFISRPCPSNKKFKSLDDIE
jgi:hypothetical protein